MKKNRSFAIGGVLCCFALLAGCASSELVDIWSDSSFQSPPLNKMLVVSVLRNSVYRRMWEDALSAGLTKHGVAVTPSYRLFPDAVPDTNQIMQIVQSNSFDGVLVTRRLPPETNTQYVEGYVTAEQNMRTFDVWATRNEGQMIWSATSNTPEPNSIQEVRPEIVKLVMSELTQKRIIASER